jgi:ribosomal protein L14
MIQKGIFLNVVYNLGAEIAYYIYNISNLNSRYVLLGNIILVSIKKLCIKRRFASKIKKGALAYGLIICPKIFRNSYYGDKLKFYENYIISFFKKIYNLIGTVFSVYYLNFFGLLNLCEYYLYVQVFVHNLCLIYLIILFFYKYLLLRLFIFQLIL